MIIFFPDYRTHNVSESFPVKLTRLLRWLEFISEPHSNYWGLSLKFIYHEYYLRIISQTQAPDKCSSATRTHISTRWGGILFSSDVFSLTNRAKLRSHEKWTTCMVRQSDIYSGFIDISNYLDISWINYIKIWIFDIANSISEESIWN